jgi:hypothetical protein
MTRYVDGFVLPISKKNLGNPFLNIHNTRITYQIVTSSTENRKVLRMGMLTLKFSCKGISTAH